MGGRPVRVQHEAAGRQAAADLRGSMGDLCEVLQDSVRYTSRHVNLEIERTERPFEELYTHRTA